MKSTVVMTTYNGEKYIIEQLDSIRTQIINPEEVVICDDCSTDNTVNIVRTYIREYSLDSWRVFVNPTNLGWKQNFVQGIRKANNEIIFLADQDDVWRNDKVSIMLALMEQEAKINILCSNYAVLNETGERIIQNKHLDSINDKKMVKVKIDEKFHLVGRPGCTYCIRRSFAQKALMAWQDDYAHDKLLWMAGMITQSLYRINDTLISYRRHGNNASGKGHVKDNRVRAHYQSLDSEVYRKISKIFANEIELTKTVERNRIILDKYIEWSDRRVRNLINKNISDSLFCITAVRFYSSILSLIADII